MYLKFERLITVSCAFSGSIATSKLISYDFKPSNFKYDSTSGVCSGDSTLKGSIASNVTIQAEIDDAKFFAKNGPNGMYSHF